MFRNALIGRGVVILLAISTWASAQAAVPVEYAPDMVEHQVRIPRLEGVSRLSTDLSKPPWSKAARLTGNLDWRRIRTADLPITTYLFYDREALYLGYRSETTLGKDLRISVRERDADMKKDDHLTFELDAGPTGRVFYRFAVNPLGTLFDSVIIDKSWNSTAEVLTATDKTGWTGVMRMPFKDFGLGEPAANTFWKFNLSTRSGFDNSWAPVLGGYHIPEQFAKLVFGTQQDAAVRMTGFKPLRMGANTIRVECPAKTLWQCEVVDQQSGALAVQAGEVGPEGTVSLQLADDRVDHVNFVFRDPTGKLLLSFWRPTEIPEVLRRLPELREKARFVEAQAAKLPEAVRAQAREAISKVSGLQAGPAAATPEGWAGLHAQLGTLERQLTDLWLYAHTLKDLAPTSPMALAIASPMDRVMI